LASSATVVALFATFAAGAHPLDAADSSVGSPTPLSGTPLGSTGLRLVVSAVPSVLLDVDADTTTPIGGITAPNLVGLSVVPVGGVGAVVTSLQGGTESRFYWLGPGTTPRYLGVGSTVWPTELPSHAVWILRKLRGSCALRLVEPSGRVLRRTPIPCVAARIPTAPGGKPGIAVSDTRLIDPYTGRTTLRTRLPILALAGTSAVLAGPGSRLTVLDTRSGRSRRVPWPSQIGDPHGEATVSPDGRYVAISTGDPAWQLGSEQVLDVWVLDLQTGKLAQLPGMPAFVHLKFTGMAWASDGRLVLLARENDRDMKETLAVWRPGETRLSIKSLAQIDRGRSGSDSFAPIE